jgi:hypothetical protein
MQSEKNQAEQDHRRDQQQGDPVKLPFKKPAEFLPDRPPAFFVHKIFAPSHSLSDYVDYDASKIGINAPANSVD